MKGGHFTCQELYLYGIRELTSAICEFRTTDIIIVIFRISPDRTEKSKEKVKVVLQRTGKTDFGQDNFCHGKL